MFAGLEYFLPAEVSGDKGVVEVLFDHLHGGKGGLVEVHGGEPPGVPDGHQQVPVKQEGRVVVTAQLLVFKQVSRVCKRGRPVESSRFNADQEIAHCVILKGNRPSIA